MAECGICLDALHSPVSIPCGHIHCERCLRAHISAGADALKSACPTCRKAFHIATPDFAFVPQKYHDFILPSVRKIYMDVPSVAKLVEEIDILNRRVQDLVKENKQLSDCSVYYRRAIEDLTTEKNTITEREEDARQEATELRKKYDSLKKRYRESRDSASNTTSQSLSSRSSQNFDTSHEILPKAEEQMVSLQDSYLNLRPKRALPKSRLSSLRLHKDESIAQCVKRQRRYRYSDVGSSSQVMGLAFEDGDEEDE